MSNRPSPATRHASHSRAPRGHAARLTAAVTVPLFALILAGCGESTTTTDPPTASTSTAPSPSAESSASGVTIEISSTAFSPSDLSVSVGDTITVTNTSQLEHSWTSDAAGIHSDVLAPGESYTFTVSTPGTFDFNCTVHPEMTGTITVS